MLATGSLIEGDVAESVNVLLPNLCRVQRLEWVPRWRTLVDDALPGLFLPTGQ
ncbi:hypothetical protein Ato02nite_013990 [Paractinoplanes toevensis]|uniref:Uncharacterized protein n=1 Tax=Paractinoplanes toevensis TaxID=571911 RepID=A0A919T8N8_9ACTN|nr:hypothetical protein Ato02nite_013990 [Actinoplanes toevensis]